LCGGGGNPYAENRTACNERAIPPYMRNEKKGFLYGLRGIYLLRIIDIKIFIDNNASNDVKVT